MENLAPPLDLILEVRFGLEKGVSLKRSLLMYIQSRKAEPLAGILSQWLYHLESGMPTDELKKGLSFYRRQILDLLEHGLRGDSIYPQVCALEDELFESSKLELEQFIATLPLKSLIPLLLLQFPAFMLLLLGPFLLKFLTQGG